MTSIYSGSSLTETKKLLSTATPALGHAWHFFSPSLQTQHSYKPRRFSVVSLSVNKNSKKEKEKKKIEANSEFESLKP